MFQKQIGGRSNDNICLLKLNQSVSETFQNVPRYFK